jgi:hypothetical protein
MKRAALTLVAALALASCGGGQMAAKPKAQTDTHPPAPQSASPGRAPSGAAAIRDWMRSMDAGEYDRAASYFARNAIVEQVREMRLRTHAEAVNFLRGLPCKADVTKIVNEGRTLLASFKLRAGPGGPCKGSARVRFKIEHGRFTEWRQLLEPVLPKPPGTSA